MEEKSTLGMNAVDGMVGTQLDLARQQLLDLGLRNPLLNYRPLRSRGVEVIDATPEEVFQALVRERKAISFVPQPQSDAAADSVRSEAANTNGMAAARPRDLKLQTALDANQLQDRLLKTYYAARTHIEERGANILYITLGQLQWYEAPQSQEPHRAPLLLVPVQLDRASIGSRFQVTYTEEDIEENLSLTTKLQREFGLTMPLLPEIEDLDVCAYFREVAQAIQSEARWAIDDASVVLGFFSFGKFMMYRDLDVTTWPAAAQPAAHPILQALLLEQGFREQPLPFSDDDNVDEHVTPAESPQVVDADSSQTLALLSVKGGRNLVIQGPPGTGKSQTITNLIADAIDRGKTVLFVAEKMAALEVVKRRLDMIGLGVGCLELHSQKAHKSTVIKDLARTLDLGRPRQDERSHDLATMSDLRAQLNQYSAAMNMVVGDTGVTPHHAFGALLRLRARCEGQVVALPRLSSATMAWWAAAEYHRRAALVDSVQSCLAAVTVTSDNVFWSTQRMSLSPIEHGRVRDAVTAAAGATETLRRAIAHVASLLGVSPVPAIRASAETMLATAQRLLTAPDLRGVCLRQELWQAHEHDVQDLLAAKVRLAHLYREYGETLRPEVWIDDLSETQRILHAYANKWWRGFSGAYRRERRRIMSLYRASPPSDRASLQGMVDAMIDAHHKREFVQQHDHIGTDLFGERWQSGEADWDLLTGISQWVLALYRDIVAGHVLAEGAVAAREMNRDMLAAATRDLTTALAHHQEAVRVAREEMGLPPPATGASHDGIAGKSFEDQEATLRDWASSIGALQAIITAKHAIHQCRQEGLGEVSDLAMSWPQARTHLLAAWQQAWFEGIVDRAFRERPVLATFDGAQHMQAITKFRDLDKSLFTYNQARLAFLHWEKLPHYEAGGQLGVLRREFEKKARHLPIRTLMQRAGHAIQAIKPVFMMSPLSIATFMPPGSLTFDLIIFDEASQVKPVDALGAIARGRQAVVVGDNQQLPPTSFFDAMLNADATEAEESVTEDIESILRLFAAQRAPQRMLRWHYRSRHESLIAVSNSEFYDHRLIVFPSPDAAREEGGLVFRHLPQTSYDRGRSRTNMKEAAAVAQAVLAHARATPGLSLGVAAFSIAQMHAILDQLEMLRRADASCEDFFVGHPDEPFFVKNLETVQGDERDVIFISIGYGRTADGYLAMDFGPLNRLGGERRLNVLITRARRRCEVFTNLTGDDIDLERTQARGVQALKTFLSYAQYGRLDVPVVTGREMESPFEEAVAAALTARGYEVRPQVGSAGFFIDLAIVDPASPGRYLLGIECDGATYHSARSARDRDRLRQQVLERLGWRLHRIWSTDWFRDPDSELQRVVAAIDEAMQHGIGSPTAPPWTSDDVTEAVERESPAAPRSAIPVATPYLRATLPITTGGYGLHEISRLRIADWIARIVGVESPVHEAEVARRIVEAAGVKRIGNRIDEAFRLSAEQAVRSGMVRRQGTFLWAPDMHQPIVRDRSGLSAASRKLEFVAPEEIALAVKAVVDGTYGIETAAIPPAVGQLLGFGRVSDDMRVRIEAIVMGMIEDKHLVQQGSHVITRKG